MATNTYKQTNNPTATYGENSASVKALQQATNAKNAGVAGYSAIKEDGKYGPLTQQAVNFSAPSSPVADDSERYSRINNEMTSEQDRLRGIVSNIGDAPSQAGIRDELMRNNQALIDSINADYAGRISSENALGDVRNDRTRALNVGAGTSGSTFASANAQRTENANAKIEAGIKAERDAKIQATLAGVAFQAGDMFQKQQAEYRKGAESALSSMSAWRDEAKANIAELANMGIIASQLKKDAPETWEQFMKLTGVDENTLSAMWVAQNQQAPIFQEKVGNSLIFGYRDPQTGKISQEKVQIADGYTDMKVIDGVPYFVDVDNGKLKRADGFSAGGGATGGSTSTATGKKYTSGSMVTNTGNIASIEQSLDNTRGKDGWVNPDAYKEAYDAWTELGGLRADFISKFPPKDYANPSNKILPAYLQNTKKQTAEETAKDATARNDFR